MNAKKIRKILDYLPRWAWYLISFFVAGPFGILGVYLVFHVLGKIEKEQAGQSREEDVRRNMRGADRSAAAPSMDDREVERRWRETEDSAARAHARRSAETRREPLIDDDATVEDVIRAGTGALRDIREANDIIADEALSAQIDSIETSCRQILAMLDQRPQLLGELRTFLRYYLPTTLRLLDARAKLENTARTPKAREVRERISEAVGVIDKAFLKQVDALDAYRFLDLESEMDVLRDMLRADGLIDEGKEKDDPFASVLGGK